VLVRYLISSSGSIVERYLMRLAAVAGLAGCEDF
jgi:hypothetical protein